MSAITLALIIFGIMLVLMAVRVPISIAMFAAGTIGYVMQTGWGPCSSFLNAQAFARFASYDLSVIPLLILMGQFATQGGLKLRAPTRQVTKLLGVLGATPVGMPPRQIPDALSKGTSSPGKSCPRSRLTSSPKFHAEFDPAGGSLYTTTFVMAMNKAKYNALPPELKKVIDNNSGMAASAWLGKVQQGNDVPGRKTASDRGNTIYTVSAAEAQEFRRKSRTVEVEWVEDMNKKGFDGKKQLDTARSLIEKYSKASKT